MKKETRSIKKDNFTNLNTEEKNYYALHAGKSSFDCRLLIILTVELNTYAANRFVIPIMHVQTWHKFQIFDLFSAWCKGTRIGHWTLLYYFSALLHVYIATYPLPRALTHNFSVRNIDFISIYFYLRFTSKKLMEKGYVVSLCCS